MLFVEQYKTAFLIKDNAVYFVVNDENSVLSTFNDKGEHIGNVSSVRIDAFDSKGYLAGYSSNSIL